MRSCPKCKCMIENDKAKFCRKCGTKLPESISMDVSTKFEEKEDSNVNQNVNSEVPHSVEKPTNLYLGLKQEDIQPPQIPSNITDGEMPLPKPRNYLAWAIVTTFLCFPPFGLYAIICASRVDSNYRAGNYNESVRQSVKAKKWTIVTALTALILYIVIYFAAFIYGMSIADNNTSSSAYEESNSEESVVDNVMNNVTRNPSLTMLKIAIKEGASELPTDIGSGMVIKNMTLEGDDMIYEITCDEDLIDIDQLDESKKEVKQNIKNELLGNDSDIDEFVDLCKKSHKNICYRYIGDKTLKECFVRIKYEEL